MTPRQPASARGPLSSARGPLRERRELQTAPGGWWANMQKSANHSARGPRVVHTQLEVKHPNTARGAIGTPKRPTPAKVNDPPLHDLGNFRLLPSSATLLIGAAEPEDCVITKGTSRVGLALWHE